MKPTKESEYRISYMQFGIRADQQKYLKELPYGTQAAFVRDAIDIAIKNREELTKRRTK